MKLQHREFLPIWVVLGLAAAGCQAAAGSKNAMVILDRPDWSSASPLSVGAREFADGKPMPQATSAYGNNEAPHISWSNVPASSRVFHLVVEDPDAPGNQPFLHWMVVNIPASTMGLPGPGGTPCLNDKGTTGYYGPRPPDDKPHHYHFQIFATDQVLSPVPQERDSLVAAMKGHVVAKGEIVGVFTKP